MSDRSEGASAEQAPGSAEDGVGVVDDVRDAERDAETPRDRLLTTIRRVLMVVVTCLVGYHALVAPWLKSRKLEAAHAQLAVHRAQASAFAKGTPHPGIGDPSQQKLPPAVARAFAPSPLFEPVPPVGPRDWLWHQPELGQTYDQYLKIGANLPDATRRVIYILPLGEYGGDGAPSLETLAAFTRAFFGLEVRVLPVHAYRPGITAARTNKLTKKLQWHAPSILNMMTGMLPPDAYCLIAVTMTDLWPGQGWNFVFGQAALRDRVGVYSFARNDPAFFGEPREADAAAHQRKILRRGLHTMTHEIGHMFGMEHCTHFSCNLNGVNSQRESDRAPLHLCPVCLRKHYHATRIDPVKRYESLHTLYKKHGLDGEARWTAARLKELRPAP